MNVRLLLIGVLVIGGLAVFSNNYRVEMADTADNGASVKGNSTIGSSPAAVQGLQTIEREMGAVTLEVTPEYLDPGKQAVFEVSINTHSVELEHDYTKVFSLVDDTGRSYKVRDWTGGRGGHHLSGKIIFEPLSENIKVVKLSAQEIDGQSADLEWEIEY